MYSSPVTVISTPYTFQILSNPHAFAGVPLFIYPRGFNLHAFQKFQPSCLPIVSTFMPCSSPVLSSSSSPQLLGVPPFQLSTLRSCCLSNPPTLKTIPLPVIFVPLFKASPTQVLQHDTTLRSSIIPALSSSRV